MRNPTRMRRRSPSGKSRDREVKASPEKMHRAAFADESRAKLLEDPIGLQENAPEAVRVLGIIRGMFPIQWKRSPVFDFVRRSRDFHLQVQVTQSTYQALVEL